MADVEGTVSEKEVADAEGAGATGEEDFSPEFTPVVKLDEVETVRSDAEEEIVWENKCKLYRFDDGAWKERGLGVAKILKHKTTLKQRFIMHEDKTFKLRSNHLISPDTKLQQHEGNVKALVFSTIDFVEDKPKEESLCIRFGTPEKAEEFRGKYEAAVEENAKHIRSKRETGDSSEDEEAVAPSTAAFAIEAVERLAEELTEKVTVAAEKESAAAKEDSDEAQG